MHASIKVREIIPGFFRKCVSLGRGMIQYLSFVAGKKDVGFMGESCGLEVAGQTSSGIEKINL